MGIKDMIDDGATKVIDFLDEITSTGDGAGDLFKIGRPSVFANEIDPDGRVSKHIQSKMSVIDLFPVESKVPMEKINSPEDMSGLIPELNYDAPIIEYQGSCARYGLVSNYAGIRLYTTDDSQATDTITNDFSEANPIEQAINKASQHLAPIRKAIESVGGTGTKDALANKAQSTTKGAVDSVASMLGASEGTKQTLGNLTELATNVIMKGNKVSFPRLWGNSEYVPNLTVNVKLVSPYGHPKAIQEFIMRPLMHLLILCTAHTSDGVSYGRPQSLTINAYGSAYSPLGALTSLTMNRGGKDTSYNIYRQPLTVNLSLTFDFLIRGFAHFSSKAIQTFEDGLFETGTAWANDLSKAKVKDAPTLATIGKIIQSLRPIQPNHLTESAVSINDYGKGPNPEFTEISAVKDLADITNSNIFK